MAIVPLTIFVLFVVLALGGPVNFVNTVSLWVVDFAQAVISWLKDL
jgi:hypothetical protein